VAKRLAVPPSDGFVPASVRPTMVPGSELRTGDVVLVETGDVIPSDGEVILGVASVDESAITGESAPVIRESGGDRSAVTGGTRVLSDWLVVRITSEPGEAFLDRMIAMVEGAERQKTPNETALDVLLALCLIPTTIGGLLSAIGIAGMDRMIQANVIAMSGRAVEAAGDIDVLLLDKTGTITLGNRQATAFLPADGVGVERLADAAQLASLADETPEGRSIVVLAKERHGLRERDVRALGATFIPFSAHTRMSGVDLDGRRIRKGAADAVEAYVGQLGGTLPDAVRQAVERIAREGGTPLVVSDGPQVLGTVELKDVVKGGIRERFAELRRMGIKTVMIADTGPGIPPEQRERIFERSVQGADGGEAGAAGLGLAIVRDIVQAHGGRIHVESEVGKGSRLTLELPRG